MAFNISHVAYVKVAHMPLPKTSPTVKATIRAVGLRSPPAGGVASHRVWGGLTL